MPSELHTPFLDLQRAAPGVFHGARQRVLACFQSLPVFTFPVNGLKHEREYT
jgi:hypothetical protein